MSRDVNWSVDSIARLITEDPDILAEGPRGFAAGALAAAGAAGLAGYGTPQVGGIPMGARHAPQVSKAVAKPTVSITDAVKIKHNRAVSSVQQQLGVSESGGTAFNRNDSIKGEGRLLRLVTTFEIRFESEKAKAEALASINMLNHYYRGGVVQLSGAPRFSRYNNENTGLYTVTVLTYSDADPRVFNNPKD